MMTLNELIEGTGGKLFCGQADSITAIATNSQDENLKSQAFIPLKGENHDAHKFVPQALEKGVSAVVFHQFDEEWRKFSDQCAFIQVEDTLEALQKLAHFWRKKFSIPVLAITGSNGKTTTKDFAAQILGQKGRTCASEGSYNNHWGVPLTLLKIREDDQFAVIEMGMNHPGEITVLNKIAAPDVVVVTNVGRAHMGFFKDVSEIAKAKQEIYASAPSNAKMIFNKDNEWTKEMSTRFKNHLCYSRSKNEVDLYFKIKEKTRKGFKLEGKINSVQGEAEVSFWGEQNVENLLAAAALSLAAGLSPQEIWQALPSCHTGWGRNQWLDLGAKGQALFDGYNANPESFSQLLVNLENSFPYFDRKVAVFGEMLELGDQAASEHEELGRKAAALAWDKVFFIGPSAKSFQRGWQSVKDGKRLIISNSYKEFLEKDMQSMLNPQALLVIKGSRGLRLERVVESIQPQGSSL